MKFVRVLLLCFVTFFLLCAPVLSHAGRTDSQGGHRNSSTGEYHYHHGYSAHQHTDLDGDGDLDCPFDFDDKTGQSPGSKSSSKSSPQTSETYTNRFSITPSTTKESNSAETTTAKSSSVPVRTSEPSDEIKAIAVIFVCAVAFFVAYHYIGNRE